MQFDLKFLYQNRTIVIKQYEVREKWNRETVDKDKQNFYKKIILRCITIICSGN